MEEFSEELNALGCHNFTEMLRNSSTYGSEGFNNNTRCSSEELLRHSLPTTVIYCIAYSIVFVVGLVGNVLVMMVVARTRIMKTTVFYFLFNLALADLLVIIFCVPATLISNVYTGEQIYVTELKRIYSSI